MEQCKWLYVHESIDYFSLISLWNLKWRLVPLHLTFKIKPGPDNTLLTSPARILTSKTSYRWKSTEVWNSLPVSIRAILSLCRFKTSVRKWILERRDIQPDWHTNFTWTSDQAHWTATEPIGLLICICYQSSLVPVTLSTNSWQFLTFYDK